MLHSQQAPMTETAEAIADDLLEVTDVDSRTPALPPSVNATAYRIFKMLVWLNEGPLSVTTLNEKFIQDPHIAKKLSSDSIWLYINTLKALGCDIRRPMRSNQFRYVLHHHPFGMYLSQNHLMLLSDIKSILEKQASPQMILQFDRFLKKMVQRSSGNDHDRFLAAVFQKSRSLDYEADGEIISLLELAIAQNDLLLLHYQSPVKGKETLLLLPDEVMYQNGVLYVLGHQHGRSEASMLRVDRIEHAEVAQRPEIHKKLMQQREQITQVHIRFYDVSLDDVPAFGLNETLIPVRVPSPDNPDERMAAVEVRLETRHYFLLRQKILESGLAFHVLSPQALADNMRETLQQMLAVYELDGEGAGGEKG